MDTKLIEYILMIAQENNITHAASKLYITQSALNQQLIKLENELGTPLFHRSRNNCQLTPAGEIYIKNAKEMLRLKRETYQMISDISDGEYGYLSVGFTSGRGINMFSSIYADFHKQYPDVTVKPVDGIVRVLQKKIAQGELDIGFLTLTDKDRTDDVYENISMEEIFLVIPAAHPLSRFSLPVKDGYGTMDVRMLREEPFVFMDRSSTMRTIIDNLFKEAGFSPKVLLETGNNHTILSMIELNLCCGIMPYYYVKDLSPSSFTCFHLPSRPTWSFVASYKRGSYLSKPAKNFIQLMKEKWGDV